MIFSIFTNNNKTGGGHRKRTIRLARYISNLKNIPIKFFENIDFNSLKFNDNVKFCIIDISLIEFQSNINKIKK